MVCKCGGKLRHRFWTRKDTETTTQRVRTCKDCGESYYTTEMREEKWTSERKKSTL